LKKEIDNNIFVTRTLNVLMIIMCLKTLGYFTLSENVAITRVLKVIIRVSMTFWVVQVNKKIMARGFIPSFHKEHTLGPFFYGVYLLLGYASLLWSTNPGYSLLQLVMNIESFYFTWIFMKAFVLFRMSYPSHQIRFSRIMAPGVFIILLGFVIGMYVNPDQFYRLTHGGEVARLGGYLMNPNELGMLAVVGIGSGCVELMYRNKKGLYVFMILVMLFALVKTGSRSSMIGFLLVVFYFINKSNQAKLKIAVYVGAFLSIPVIVQTIFIKQGDLEEVMSMTGRLPFWTALLTEGLPKEPWFGFGYMRIAYTEAFQSVHTYAGKMTHNTFIQVLMNLGFIGFAVVLLQMTFTLRALYKSKDIDDKAFFVGMFIPILINSFTEFGIFGETNYGILFYQILIWLFVFRYNDKLNIKEKISLKVSKKKW